MHMHVDTHVLSAKTVFICFVAHAENATVTDIFAAGPSAQSYPAV